MDAGSIPAISTNNLKTNINMYIKQTTLVSLDTAFMSVVFLFLILLFVSNIYSDLILVSLFSFYLVTRSINFTGLVEVFMLYL